jgi:hypothetical protein
VSVVLAPGQRICTHVRIVRPAPDGAGSRVFGEVWEAVDEESATPLWLTAIGQDFLPSIFEFSEFMAKANGLSRMRHPDLVRVSLVDREETFCVVGYERLDGASVFSELLLREKLDAQKVLRRSLSVAKGLAYLHERGIVHGVLSPATTFEWEGSTVAWQYGLTQAVDTRVLAEGARRASDEELFAPELHKGNVSPATDTWAWAALVAEMASGLSALEAVNETLDGGEGFEADPRLIELMQQCLAADPVARIASGGALVTRLEEIRRGGAVVGMSTGLAPPPPKAETGAMPMLEAGLPTESGGFIELDDVDVVESGGYKVKETRKRSESTAGLKALAKEQLGEEIVAGLDHVLESGTFDKLDDSDPHLVQLAQEGASALPAIQPIQAGFVGAEAKSADPENDFDEPVAIDQKAKAEAFKIPRTPGPHGPAPRTMTLLVLTVLLGISGLSFAHVAGEKGGPAELFGVDLTPAAPPPPDQPLAADTEGEPAGGSGDTGEELLAPDLPDVAAAPADCPKGMVPINDEFCIDVGEFPALRRVPQVSVTLRQAGTLCETRDARLCSGKEWRLACAGVEERRVPYGKTAAPEMCNTASVAGFPQETATSGAYSNCVTPEGVYDLVGNVGEWVAEGVAVGGDSTTPGTQAICTAQGRPPKGYSGPDLGFRCCADR